MLQLLMYPVYVLIGAGLLVLGALWGCHAGIRQERKRCASAVESHVCAHGEHCSARCLDKLAAVIRIRVSRED